MTTSSNKILIASLGCDLECGESARVQCPACGGGSSEEDSLSIRRMEDGSIAFQCFRATCGSKGYTSDARGYGCETRPKTPPTPPPHPRWVGETSDMPGTVEMWINLEWGMDVPESWYWTTDFAGRIAMSIRTPHDTHRGWVLRHVGNRPVRTKAYTYMEEPDTPKCSWYKTRSGGPLVIVEDIPSAVRASAYYNAVALMGTQASFKVVEEIAERRAGGRVIVALDADATQQAIELAARYRLVWEDVMVLPLPKDLKDHTEKELCETLSRIPNE